MWLRSTSESSIKAQFAQRLQKPKFEDLPPSHPAFEIQRSFNVSDPAPQTVFDVIGEDGITRLVQAFYVQVPADAILGPMYAKSDLAEAERHLRDFLIYRLGGPERYLAERGHPRLRMRHAPFVINVAARDRWLRLMYQALTSAGFPPEIDAALRSFFSETATFLINDAAP